MKRVFALILLLLILCGCTVENQEETTDTTAETLSAVEPTEPAGTYVPGSGMETETAGAVRVYDLGLADVYAMIPMGEDLVIFSGTENTTLTKLTGENRYVTASVSLNVRLDPEKSTLQVTEKGISYYDSGCLVTLGTGLKEISRVELAEDLVGEPAVSADRKRVYYCTEHYIWELTLETGISRMIKEVSETITTARGLLVEDTVLLCCLDTGEQIFLSTETGRTLGRCGGDITVTGSGEYWFAVVPEGQIDAYVFGTGEDKRMLLPETQCLYLEETNCLLTLSEEEAGIRVDCYDLESGVIRSVLTLDFAPVFFAGEEDLVYVLSAEGMLLRWDLAALPSGDDTVYATPRYTLENPDEEGYAQCAAAAEKIGSRYGVTILFGEDAVAEQSDDFDMTGEYMVPVILQELEKLEALLAVYPEGMLKAAVEDTTGGTLYICIVREVVGSAESGILDPVAGTQFWVGEDAYVAIAVGQETGNALYHQMYHAMEIRLMSNSNACYEWDSMNPSKFEYDYSYVLNQSREDDKYLEGKNRYFINTYSMSFPMEDRATILEYAMMEGNAEYFESSAMQEKLQTLCEGIREAYGLKKSPEVFLWEQYLEKSLAYTK